MEKTGSLTRLSDEHQKLTDQIQLIYYPGQSDLDYEPGNEVLQN